MSLLQQIQAASTQSHQSALVLICGHAPQLLQLEQQAAAASASSAAVRSSATLPSTSASRLTNEQEELYQFVASYCAQHERDHSYESSESSLSRSSSSSSSASHTPSSTSAPASAASASAAPLFFYLLMHPDSQEICLSFLSALYTDPSRDQDFYWLNDPMSLVDQVRIKLELLTDIEAKTANAYARTKTMDLCALSANEYLLTGIVQVLQTLVSTRVRAIGSRMASVNSLLSNVRRQQWRAQCMTWFYSRDDSRSESVKRIDQMLAGHHVNSWYHDIAERRSFKAASHARAFRSLLQGIESSDAALAVAVVDEEYSEEPELCADRLWSLASNSAQHHGHVNLSEEKSGAASAADSGLSWHYPPPSMHAIFDVFLLSEPTPSDAPLASAPPPSYKLWLIYYFLLDFESRSPAAAAVGNSPSLSASFAQMSGFNPKQTNLIQAMLYLDQAYQQSSNDFGSVGVASPPIQSILSPQRHQSLMRALTLFASDYHAVLSQPDFPLISAILASITVLQQWDEGVTFFQNAFLANAAASASLSAYFIKQTQLKQLLLQRRITEEQFEHETASQPQVQVVFYSTFQHVLYVHLLLEKGLHYEAMQFIRSQADCADEQQMANHDSNSNISNTLQIILWNYWNNRLLQQRQYQLLLKEISLSELEESLLLSYWKQLATQPVASVSAALHFSAPPHSHHTTVNLMSPVDLLILYHIERNHISKALTLYRSFTAMQKKNFAASASVGAPVVKSAFGAHHVNRAQVHIPHAVLDAYAKLVNESLEVGENEDEWDSDAPQDELDFAVIQLHSLKRHVSKLVEKHRLLMSQIYAAQADQLEGGGVEMFDANRIGADLNPFSAVNDAIRAAAASARQKTVTPAVLQPVAPNVSPSPEKTPRIQAVSATLSAAKQKRNQQAKEREERAQAQQLAHQAAESNAAAMDDADLNETKTAEQQVSELPKVDFTPVASRNLRRTQATPLARPTDMQEDEAATPVPTIKVTAFSDSTNTSGPNSNAAAFLLPLPDQPVNASPLPVPRSSRATRSTRTSKASNVLATPTAASQLQLPVDEEANSTRSTRKRALVVPPSASNSLHAAADASAASVNDNSTPVSRLTRHSLTSTATESRASRGAAASKRTSTRRAAASASGADETMSPVAEVTTKTRSSRASKRTSSTNAESDATAAAAAMEDVSTTEVVSLLPAITASSSRSRRTAAGSASSSRRVRSGALFIDETALLPGGALALESTAIEQVGEPEVSTKRTSRASRSVAAAASPSPPLSASTSPVRPTRGRASRAKPAESAPVAPVSSTRTRATRAAAAAPTVTEEPEEAAPLLRRSTRAAK